MALIPALPRYLPIAWKLAAVTSALTLLTVVVLATLVLHQVRDVLHDQIRAQADLIVGHIARASAEPILADDRLALQTLVQAQLQHGEIEFLAVHANDQGLLASAGQRPGTQPLNAHPHWSLVPSSHHQYRPVLFQGVEVGWVEAYIDTAAMQGLLHNTIRAGVATAVVVSVLGLVLAIAISKRLVRPLERLAKATRKHAAATPGASLVQDELGQLIHAFRNMSTDLLRKDQVEDALRRYVSDGVAQDILDNLDRIELGGDPVEGSVLFADIKGYTTLSEQLDPAELGRILNEFFGPMASTIAAHGGVVDKYIGDCTMAVFGVTRPDVQHRLNALRAGLALLNTIRDLNRAREERGDVRVEFRIGLHAGRMLAGNLGAEDRMQYTVVGGPVNLASRLTEIAEPDSLLVTDGFMPRDELSQRFRIRSRGRRRLRGVAGEVELLSVLGER
ncbi:adenylate/guanylate cyclase domain-containing protein [Thioalkalivibrio paradoxus]|uniref:Cyclase n=1 Tax=Thioalkalivibrio paradoxus ARh 1 TaxID=713585 RepID=W0DRU4_9GAMM|nr:adenylate/guanylate cyclase domain-containing protein [Thioalkalivibrio paradoxus]AHE99585.1 cyclase [Thioalkalivibrio paradoxus ARh 1]